MTPVPQVHPALTRLRRRLELCRAPLVRLWSWPQAGRRLLLDNLTRFHPDSWLELSTEQGLLDAVRRAPSHAHLWWPEEVAPRADVAGEPFDSAGQGGADSDGGALLGEALDALAPGQRLYLLGRPCLGDEAWPEVWIAPDDWLLTGGELAAVVEDPFAETSIDGWIEFTAGWWGPVVWLLQRGSADAAPWEADPEGLAQWLHGAVLVDLSPLQRELLDAFRLTGCHDVSLWRRVCLPHAELLQAFEEALQIHGWLIGPWPRLWDRIPWTTTRQHVVLGPFDTETRRAHLHGQLGAAAAAMGKSAAAVHHLRLAGQSERLKRWKGWSDGDDAETATEGLGEGSSRTPEGVLDPTTTVVPSVGAPQRVFEVDLLGPPRVVDVSRAEAPQPVRWTLRRALMTLAYLLLAPQHRATRDELITAVWEGVDERGIAKNFHPTLSTLRRVLGKRSQDRTGRRGGSLIHFRQGVYSLSEDAEWHLDVDRFDDLMQRGQELQQAGRPSWEAAVESWQQAWRLYQGQLLGDAEASWVVAKRRRLHTTYRRLLRQLADLLSDLRRDDEALDVYRALLLEEPFEETVHLAVMELYSRQGRRDLVRRQFVRLQELLRSELGVEPRATTQQRFHELMH